MDTPQFADYAGLIHITNDFYDNIIVEDMDTKKGQERKKNSLHHSMWPK